MSTSAPIFLADFPHAYSSRPRRGFSNLYFGLNFAFKLITGF